MSRPVRIELPGANYLVTSRGKDGNPVFQDEADFAIFLNIVAHVVDHFDWLIHGYVLMKDHYHLVVEIPKANLSRGMRQLNGVYTQHVNRRHDKGGSVFHGRFKGILFEKKSYLLPVCRYVVTQPATLNKDGYSDYRWSSYLATIGQVKPPSWLCLDEVLGSAPGNNRSKCQNYRDYIQAGVGEPSPLEERTNQVLLGSQRFLSKMKPILQGEALAKRRPKAAGRRRSLSTMFRNVQNKPRIDRNVLMKMAHREQGYTLAEIGDHLGLHYTTVSKVINSV